LPSIGPDRQKDRSDMLSSRLLAHDPYSEPYEARGVGMSASSGEKRRRKRDRQFLEFYDTLSVRATLAGVGGSIALLLFVVARSVFSI
jgi:hypothetical protein